MRRAHRRLYRQRWRHDKIVGSVCGVESAAGSCFWTIYVVRIAATDAKQLAVGVGPGIQDARRTAPLQERYGSYTHRVAISGGFRGREDFCVPRNGTEPSGIWK